MNRMIDLSLLDSTLILPVASPEAASRPKPALVATLDDVIKAAFTLPEGTKTESKGKGKSFKDELAEEFGDLEALERDADAIPDDLQALLSVKDVKKHLWGYDVETMETHLKPFGGSSLYADAAKLVAEIFRISARIERLARGYWDDLADIYVDPDEQERKMLEQERCNVFAELTELTAKLYGERAERVASSRDAIKGFGEGDALPKDEDAPSTTPPAVTDEDDEDDEDSEDSEDSEDESAA